MNTLKPIRLHDLKIGASFLLKNLRSRSQLSHLSAKRFIQLSSFAGKTEDWLIEHSDSIRLKHAYAVLAHENGFQTWANLKKHVLENDCLYRSCCVAFIHAWFSSYHQAEVYFKSNGGYLISFWKDFVVCGKEYISCIGLSHYQAEWERIGYNWVKPEDIKTLKKLKEIAKKNYQTKQGKINI